MKHNLIELIWNQHEANKAAESFYLPPLVIPRPECSSSFLIFSRPSGIGPFGVRIPCFLMSVSGRNPKISEQDIAYISRSLKIIFPDKLSADMANPETIKRLEEWLGIDLKVG